SLAPDYGWGAFAQGGVEVTIVPAPHEKILEDPCVRAVASALNGLLPQGEPGNGISREATEVAFWKNHLQGIPALLELPTDRPRPATQSGRMGCERLTLTPEIGRKLDAVSGEIRVEKADLLLASLHALLYR